jgi:hypothetical protein
MEQHASMSGLDGAQDTDNESDADIEAYIDSVWGPTPSTPEGESTSPGAAAVSRWWSRYRSRSRSSTTGSWADIPRFDGSSGSTVKRRRTALDSLTSSEPANLNEPRVRTAEALLSFRGIAQLRANRSMARVGAMEEESPRKHSWNSWGYSPRRRAAARPTLPLNTSETSSANSASSTSSDTSSSVETPLLEKKSPLRVVIVPPGARTPPLARDLKPQVEAASPITPVSDDEEAFQLAQEVVLVSVAEEANSKSTSVKTNRSQTPAGSPESGISDATIAPAELPRDGMQKFLELNPVTSPPLECICGGPDARENPEAGDSPEVELHSSVPVVEVTIEHRTTPPATPAPTSPSRSLNPEAQLELDGFMRQLMDSVAGLIRLAARQDNPRELVLVFAVVGYRLWQWFLDGLARRVGTRLRDRDPEVEAGKKGGDDTLSG